MNSIDVDEKGETRVFERKSSQLSKQLSNACLAPAKRSIVKPDPLIRPAYARFDEGGLVMVSMDWLLRHRQTKGAETDRLSSNDDRSLSSTLPLTRPAYT